MKYREAFEVLRKAYGIPEKRKGYAINPDYVMFACNMHIALTYNLYDWDKWREENE